MTYYSLHDPQHQVDFATALLQGLAPDGGLYFPSQIPRFSEAEVANLPGKTLPEIGRLTLQKWLQRDIDSEDLEQIVTEALSFPIPLIQVGDKYVLELFHGPTMAFKDVAAGLLARLMSHFVQKNNTQANILVATSGDTGGAVANGFSGVEGINVFVLFPKGKVSQLQQEQLTRVEANIFPIEVEGNFDDCQAMVKRAFNDSDLSELSLTSANSINIGRLLPQIIYHIYVYSQLADKDLQVVVPSGNFGNLAAGFFARAMGLPMVDFVAAVNANDTVARFLQTGQYEPRQAVATLSNAMDIADPSNFVRILQLFNQDQIELKKYLQAQKVTDEKTVDTIKKVYAEQGYLLCPHTAVAWKVAEDLQSPNLTQVVYSTAAPAKFAGEITQATGILVDNTEELTRLRAKPSRQVNIKNDYEELKGVLTKRLA